MENDIRRKNNWVKNDRRFKLKKKYLEIGMFFFVNLKEVRFVGGDFGKVIKIIVVDFGVVDFV